MRRRTLTQAYQKALARAATKRTRALIAEALREDPSPAHMTIEVWGKVKAEAYMYIGWEPISSSLQAGIEVYSLRMDTPHMGW
jgi:hypothetical protein